MTTSSGPSAATISDNHIMARPATAPLRRILGAPFTQRTWAELAYAIVSALHAAAALIFIVPTLANGPLWALSAPGVRKLGAGSRHLARGLLGEAVPAPPQPRPALLFKVRTTDGARLAVIAAAAGAKVRVWEGTPGVTVRRIPPSRIAELAAEAGIAIDEIQPINAVLQWLGTWILDPVAWRARAYFAIKVPLAGLGLAVAGSSGLAACFS
jgi:hypothetical protein